MQFLYNITLGLLLYRPILLTWLAKIFDLFLFGPRFHDI